MPQEDEEEPLEVYWDALRGRRGPIDPVHTAPTLRDLVDENDMVIGTSAQRILVIIKPTGELIFGPEYTPQEASMIFWEYMGRRRFQLEDRILLIQHMEAVLVRLGRADMDCERLRREAASADNPQLKAERTQQAEIAVGRLNMVAHEAIELGRGLVHRPEVLPPDVPERVPEQIRQNPDSEYLGRDGLPPENTSEG
jgi:hypothetical protein